MGQPKFRKGTKIILVLPGKYTGLQLQKVIGYDEKTQFYKVKNLHSGVIRQVRRDKLDENYQKVLG